MLPKRITLASMGILTILVVGFTMAWQVAPALAGITPTPVPPTATAIPPTTTGLTPTALSPTSTTQPSGTAVPPTATAGLPTQPPAENTPEMPVTGGQISDSSDSGIGVAIFLGMVVLLFVAISLISRRVGQNKNRNIGGV